MRFWHATWSHVDLGFPIYFIFNRLLNSASKFFFLSVQFNVRGATQGRMPGKSPKYSWAVCCICMTGGLVVCGSDVRIGLHAGILLLTAPWRGGGGFKNHFWTKQMRKTTLTFNGWRASCDRIWGNQTWPQWVTDDIASINTTCST